MPGRNTSRELVRNPLLTPLNQHREAMLKLAKAVPLVDAVASKDRARQYTKLSDLLRGLTTELGLTKWQQGEPVWFRIGNRDIPDPEPVVGITDGGGYLLGDTSYLLSETRDE